MYDNSYWVGAQLLLKDVLLGAHDPSFHGGMRLYPDASMNRCSHYASISEVPHLCLPGCNGTSLLSAACGVGVDMAQQGINDSMPRLGLQMHFSCRAVRVGKKALEGMLRKLIPHQWLSLPGT